MSRSHCFNCRKRLRTKKDIKSVDENRSCLQCYKRVKYGAATVDGEGTPATAETAAILAAPAAPASREEEEQHVADVAAAPSPSDGLLAISVGARLYRRRRHDVDQCF